ncbi:MAG: hypothetical protein JXA99_15635 [Candidatus Lokiarchaeota archaeon]|nr:hypothetical protein [Candidatus Lokiarchaeota archaeon]
MLKNSQKKTTSPGIIAHIMPKTKRNGISYIYPKIAIITLTININAA